MLIIDHLTVGYNVPCIDPISLTIQIPGIYGIIGPNGSGKSTFLKTIVGLNPPISGKCQLINLPNHAYVPQYHTVNRYFHLSLRDFVLQGCGPYKNNDTCACVDHYIKDWQLSEQTKKCFHELSGGQKTRAMIIRALISNPDIISLDEPLASLDNCCQLQLMETLHALVKKGKKYIFISDHHLGKFKMFITAWLEFSKQHDANLASINYIQEE